MNPYESPQIAQPIVTASMLDDEPVVAEFDFTPDFVIGILKRHRSLHPLSVLFDVFKYLVGLGLLGVAAFLIVDNPSLAGLFVGGLGMFLLFSGQINHWQMRRRLLASPYVNEVIRLEFSDAGMHALSKSQDTKLKWNLFTRMVQFDEGVLLMQGPNQCNWIANESILGEFGRERLNRLLTAKIVNSEDRRTRRSL